MPTRRQILHGMGVLAIGGLAVNKLLMQPLYPHSRAAASPIRRAAAGRPGCGVNKGSGGSWQAISAATGGLIGYRGYNTPGQGTPADQIRTKLGNVPLAVTECNSAVQPGRPEWFRDTWAWAQANKCLTYFTFWEAAGSGSAYEWLPGDAATISALSAINATSRAG
jgi:hypothetical protein